MQHSQHKGKEGQNPPATNSDGELLELYKVAVEMADRTSARRAGANGFFITLTSALVAAVGLAPTAEPASPNSGAAANRFGLIALAIAGIVVSAAWWELLRSYQEINFAKYKVISDIETRLQASIFRDEWQILHPTKSARGRFRELGGLERVIPVVYGVIFIAAIVRSLIS